MIDFFTALPGRLLAFVQAVLSHPIGWVGLALIVFAVFVLGGMALHLRRADRATRQSNARRYDV